jgi:hypothetical protein
MLIKYLPRYLEQPKCSYIFLRHNLCLKTGPPATRRVIAFLVQYNPIGMISLVLFNGDTTPNQKSGMNSHVHKKGSRSLTTSHAFQILLGVFSLKWFLDISLFSIHVSFTRSLKDLSL